MKIALDWDETFTRDPTLWVSFVRRAQQRKHIVKIVTMRSKAQAVEIENALFIYGLDLDIIATGMNQKRAFCAAEEFFPDVWIDDTPEFIVGEYKNG